MGDHAEGLEPRDWHRLSCGKGTKGRRRHDWACLELADLDVAEYGDSRTGLVNPQPADPPPPRRW